MTERSKEGPLLRRLSCRGWGDGSKPCPSVGIAVSHPSRQQRMVRDMLTNFWPEEFKVKQHSFCRSGNVTSSRLFTTMHSLRLAGLRGMRIRYGQALHAGAPRAADTFFGVLDDDAVRGFDRLRHLVEHLTRPALLKKSPARVCRVCDIFGADDRIEIIEQSGRSEYRVDLLAQRAGSHGERQCCERAK